MIKQELTYFACLVLRLRDAIPWESETDLVAQSMTVAEALARLQELRAETAQESPWRLTRRRALEKAVEGVIPPEVLTWGSWIKDSSGAILDPIASISGVPLPVIPLLVPPRFP